MSQPYFIRKWAADEAALRKVDRKYEDAQERAEKAILSGFDYDPGDTPSKQTIRKKPRR